jgi:hypothetical protein
MQLTSISARHKRLFALAGLLTLTPVLMASLSSANLADSTFDTLDGNLKLDAGDIADWASVTEVRKGDKPSGATDDSFGNGTKEDTPVPSVVSGSIPPNKSDLTNFGVYFEQNSAGKFLHMFWHRVQEPSGTTNMDFEFNQSKVLSGNGVTPVRTAGDLLIQYDLSQGGVNPQLFLSTWLTAGPTSACEASNSLPCWSGRTNLSTAAIARGSINTSAIAAADADGLGAISARTFGEATVDFGALTAGNCIGFGSAYLKSRSSDSFTAAAKDFIAPVATDINTCGKIVIRKQTVPDGAAGSFTFTDNVETVPDVAGGFSLADDGIKTFSNTKFGTYRITESALPTDWTLTGIDCSASTGVTPSVDLANKWVDITIDAASDIGDCTFTNRKTFSPTITTLLNGTSGTLSASLGDPVYDTATLSGASSDAGGTVTYTSYSDSGCTLNARDAGTKTVTNGSVPQSNALTFNTAGTFYWQAVYSGDAFNNGATSTCTDEVLSITRNAPGASTAQNLKPNDSFTLTGGFSATGNVTFSLYGPADPTCSGAPALTESVPLSGGTSAATSNTTFVASTPGTWRWEVVYAGDANNDGVTLACGREAFTIDNDTTD